MADPLSTTIPANTSLTVLSPTSLQWGDRVFEGVSDITLGDGTVRTLQQLLDENGGQTYQPWELKPCVKVEGIDPDNSDQQIFTVYTNNSRQVGKNETASVPGGMWAEMFDFKGDANSNYIIKMWEEANTSTWSPDWLGFRLIYGIAEARVYTMTWVNDFGEESVPCPPTELGVPHLYYPRLTGRFQAPAAISVGGLQHQVVPIRYFRLYRSNTTSAGQTVFQRTPVDPIVYGVNAGYVAQRVEGNPETYFPHSVYVGNHQSLMYDFKLDDTARNEQLLEVLPSVDWSTPPIETMKGLTAWRNGMMVCFAGNTVMFSEPFRPFAWPRKYWVPIEHEVIALARDDNAIIAITKGPPYVFTGSHPANVSNQALEDAPPGLPSLDGTPSRAIASTPAGVIYAADDGLWSIAGGRARPVGRQLWTAEEWRQRYANNFGLMRLAYADGHLIGYFPSYFAPGFDVSTTGVMGFRLNLADADPQLIKYALPGDVHPTGDFESPRNGRLHLIYPPTQTVFASAVKDAFHESVARREAVYWTRKVHLAKPENLGAIEIRGHSGSVTVEVFDDGNDNVAIYTKTFDLRNGPGKGRLPAGRKARNYSVRLTLGTNTVVRELYVASTPQELERV